MIYKPKIHAVLPTYDRIRLIQKTIDSILNSSYRKIKITIVVDVNKAYYERLCHIYEKYRDINVLFNEKRLGWPNSLNRVLMASNDAFYLYGADDIYFHEMTIEIALNALRQLFDGDGVIGFQQNLQHFCPGAFGMFGGSWVDRYPRRVVFNPTYKHFCGDSELWHYAKKIDRFFLCKRCRVDHERIRDKCKSLAQTTLNKDRAIWRPRKNQGKFWPEYKF